MSSTSKSMLQPATGGVDRSVSSYLASRGTFFAIENLETYRSRLWQTPLFTVATTLTNFSAEATGNVLALFQHTPLSDTLSYLALDTTYCRYLTASNLATQVNIPFVLQTAVPDRSDATGHCLLYNVNSITATFTTLDVEIVAATTFRWRTNGGAWNTTTTIANGVGLGATGLRLGWLAVDGFTPGDRWTWTISIRSPHSGAVTYNKVSVSRYRKDVYFAGFDRHVLRLRDDRITSVGYRRIYGKYVREFANHLFIAHFAEGAYSAVLGVTDSYNAQSTPWRLAWSDLNDPDEFYPTDINEADGKDIVTNTCDDTVLFGITGLETYRGLLYIFTSDEIHGCAYVGLPNVMQIDCLNLQTGSVFQNGVIKTPRGLFFISKDNFCRYDGNTILRMGTGVRDQFFSELPLPSDAMRQKLFGVYDKDRNAATWTYWKYVSVGVYQGRQITYFLDSETWTFRNIPSAGSGVGNIMDFCPVTGEFRRRLYAAGSSLLIERVAGATTAGVLNDQAGAVPSLTEPYVITQDFQPDGSLQSVKTLNSVYVSASTGYDAATRVRCAVAIKHYPDVAATMEESPESWSVSNANRAFTAFKSSPASLFQFKFRFTGGVTADCSYSACEPKFYGRDNDNQ